VGDVNAEILTMLFRFREPARSLHNRFLRISPAKSWPQTDRRTATAR
jgi:hypothetical protein